jgi:GNAT superfamily N-acetyltransferase
MLEIRDARDPDGLATAAALHSAILPHRAITAEEMGEMESYAAHWARVLAVRDGDPVGTGGAEILPGTPERAWLIVEVLQDARRERVGSALFEHLRGWARSHGATVVEVSVEEDDPDSIAFAERRGFTEDRRESRLILDLETIEPPAVELPEALDEIVTLAERPELVHGLYDVALEAFPDIPGEEDDPVSPFEEWVREELGGLGDRPEAIFVALAGGEVVGYSKFHVMHARPDALAHDLTGVKRAWRGRGVAGALKRTQVRWAKERGVRELITMNEVRNEPIRRLNERLGYRLAPGKVHLRASVET